MVETSAAAGGYAIALTLLSIGGVLTLTIAGAIIGVPLMLLGLVIVAGVWRSDPDEDDSPDADPA
jgi:choline-glycine betaine transporter